MQCSKKAELNEQASWGEHSPSLPRLKFWRWLLALARGSENIRGPDRTRSLAQTSEFFRTLFKTHDKLFNHLHRIGAIVTTSHDESLISEIWTYSNREKFERSMNCCFLSFLFNRFFISLDVKGYLILWDHIKSFYIYQISFFEKSWIFQVEYQVQSSWSSDWLELHKIWESGQFLAHDNHIFFHARFGLWACRRSYCSFLLSSVRFLVLSLSIFLYKNKKKTYHQCWRQQRFCRVHFRCRTNWSAQRTWGFYIEMIRNAYKYWSFLHYIL